MDEDVQIAEEHFRALDQDGSGAIELQELTTALGQGLGLGPEEGRTIFDCLDTTGENRIERSQFLAAVVGSQLLRQDSVVREAFQRFDRDGSGSISPDEMTALLGCRFCGEAMEKIFGEMDANSDGTVDFGEFCSIVATV